MPEQSLSDSDARASGDEVCRARMTPKVGSAGPLYASRTGIALGHEGDGLLAHRLVRMDRREPKGSFVGSLGTPQAASPTQIRAHGGTGQRPRGHDPLPRAFAVAHAQQFVAMIHVIHGEPGHFIATNTGRVEEFENGLVAQSLFRLPVGHGQHAPRFRACEHCARQRVAIAPTWNGRPLLYGIIFLDAVNEKPN